jgi:nucleoside-diphosphate-sugar epimerase
VSRVLVTGATGFIGRQTLAPLRRRGYEVHAVSSRPDGVREHSDVSWHTADLHDQESTARLLDDVRPDALLHLAWYAEPGRFWTSAENLRWVEASLRLLRGFAERGGTRAVIAGSCAEYRWTADTVCDESATPLEAATLYGTAKHALRLVAEAYGEQAGLSIGWGRVFFVFGPYESPRRLGGSVASALVRGEPAPCSHGEQVRDFLYSADLGDAFSALLDSEVRGPVNLASGLPVRIRDLVEALAAAAGRPELVEFGALPASASEPTSLTADVSRLRTEVGWAPPASIDARAADTIAWWRAQSERPAPSARVTRS